jgi:hypothetical protein
MFYADNRHARVRRHNLGKSFAVGRPPARDFVRAMLGFA